LQRLSTPAVAIVAGKVTQLALPTAYLSRGVGEADHDSALRRIVGEWVLESFVRRAEICVSEVEARRSAEERSQLELEVKRSAEECSQLELEVKRSAEECSQLELEVQRSAEERSQLEIEAKRSAEELSHLQETVAARDEAIGSLEMKIDRLNQELAASQSRLAKQQQRVEILEGSRYVRIGRAVYRLRTHLRRWFPTPASTNAAKRHHDS
jgi:hypothetical protein